MDLRYASDGIPFDRIHAFGREAPVPSWLSEDMQSPFLIHTGDNSAGDGGDGYFAGSIINDDTAIFQPVNLAQAGSHASASAHQTNVAYFDQAATQIAGTGGDGGDGNIAIGGSASLSGPISSGAVATGDNGAGNGGNGHFSGALVHNSVAVFEPVNIATGGSHSTAEAHQSNSVQFFQSASQFAAAGGHGGDDNAAGGGDVSVQEYHLESHLGSGHHATGSDMITSGGNSAGDGGDGSFSGSIVHNSLALYDPINIVVAGYNSSAEADQTNNATFNQSAFQMAGVGGNGGSGNAAIGGDAGLTSSILGLIGSDVIATGGNSAGNGGDGHFTGSLVDLNIAIYAPINIAVAGVNSSADAHQTNNVQFDQSTIQIAGIGGDGGHGNTALGGDIIMHALADHPMLGHA
jgi:hypothetical protein